MRSVLANPLAGLRVRVTVVCTPSPLLRGQGRTRTGSKGQPRGAWRSYALGVPLSLCLLAGRTLEARRGERRRGEGRQSLRCSLAALRLVSFAVLPSRDGRDGLRGSHKFLPRIGNHAVLGKAVIESGRATSRSSSRPSRLSSRPRRTCACSSRVAWSVAGSSSCGTALGLGGRVCDLRGCGPGSVVLGVPFPVRWMEGVLVLVCYGSSSMKTISLDFIIMVFLEMRSRWPWNAKD